MDVYKNNKAFFDYIDCLMNDEPSAEELAAMDDAAEDLLRDILGDNYEQDTY